MTATDTTTDPTLDDLPITEQLTIRDVFPLGLERLEVWFDPNVNGIVVAICQEDGGVAAFGLEVPEARQLGEFLATCGTKTATDKETKP